MNRFKNIRARQQENSLYKKLRSFDHADDAGAMVAPMITGNQLVTMGPGKYNPPFKAQIQLQVLKLYFTEAAGVYTPVLAAAIDASLQVALPAFLFANADFEAGYSKLQAQFPMSTWDYEAPVRYGKDWPGTKSLGIWDSNVFALLRGGDIVLPFTALAVGGNDYLCLTVIRTSDVPAATLLAATNSNTFKINMIRYNVTAGQETQFRNPILITDETMFGKFSSDPINPESFKNPEQNQNNIIDLDVKVEINKQKGLALDVDFDVVTMRLNLFIQDATKIV